ncbi:hypothetical protein GCM10023085_17500 [Actinomadura viridis]
MHTCPLPQGTRAEAPAAPAVLSGTTTSIDAVVAATNACLIGCSALGSKGRAARGPRTST